jgi:diguanylate cyclase (GGDEF)-like protein
MCIMTRTGPFRGYFARREAPYAGGDLDNAQRISAVLWGLLVLLTIGLLPASPPSHPSKGVAWAITGVLVVLGALLVVQDHRRRISSWGLLLATGYAIVAGIGVMQWVAGGLGEPYERLLLLPVVFVAATQPPRQILAFLAFVFVVLMAPLVYDGWDAHQFGGLLASFVIWCGLGIGGNLLMSGVRAQRLSHAAEEAEARHEARIDSLTALHNRRAFDELLITEVARARRLGLPLSMAMVDIENFKEVNDRWSYAEGDRCLREVANALKDNLRQPDFCFRWGGDEFALILSGTPADETDPIAERLGVEVSKGCRRPDDTPLRIRFAVAELRDGISPPELTEMAGLALTAAKLDDDQTTNATSST